MISLSFLFSLSEVTVVLKDFTDDDEINLKMNVGT